MVEGMPYEKFLLRLDWFWNYRKQSAPRAGMDGWEGQNTNVYKKLICDQSDISNQWGEGDLFNKWWWAHLLNRGEKEINIFVLSVSQTKFIIEQTFKCKKKWNLEENLG